MAAVEYKITFEYKPALLWAVSIWSRDLLPHDQRGPWARILYHETATLEGHFEPRDRLRAVLRTLGA